MRARFAEFNAFAQDAKDNQEFAKVKLNMTVLAVATAVPTTGPGSLGRSGKLGSEKSLGATQAAIMRNVATNVQEGVVAGSGGVVAGSGHWLMEERPVETVQLNS
jgi:hypothetical protein